MLCLCMSPDARVIRRRRLLLARASPGSTSRPARALLLQRSISLQAMETAGEGATMSRLRCVHRTKDARRITQSADESALACSAPQDMLAAAAPAPRVSAGHVARPAPASAATLRPTLVARPAPSLGAKPLKLGGTAKLGASKLKGGDLDLEKLLAD